MAAPFTKKVARNSSGKRVIPTAAIDALIFGTDDRKPYYPHTYPWNCIGRLQSETASPMGSAALVGRDLMLTARHVLQGTPFSMIKSVPAYYEGQSTVNPSFFSWVSTQRIMKGPKQELGILLCCDCTSRLAITSGILVFVCMMIDGMIAISGLQPVTQQ